MPAGALALALAAAFVHAGWNVLIARAADTQATTAVAGVMAAAIYAPVAALTWDVDASVIPYVAASATLEVAYLALLASAYARGELSVVYPVARGAAPVLVAVGGALALGYGLSTAQVAGVVAVAVGVLLVRGGSGAARPRDVAFGLLIGATLATYTMIDKQGLEHADPLPYLELCLVPATLAYFALVARWRGLARLRAEARRPVTPLIAIAMFGSYALVLAALTLTDPAPVAAVRESGVVIAAAMAALFLHERVTGRRLAGAVAVTAGVAVLALA